MCQRWGAITTNYRPDDNVDDDDHIILMRRAIIMMIITLMLMSTVPGLFLKCYPTNLQNQYLT